MFTPALALLLRIRHRLAERSELNRVPPVRLEDKSSIETIPVSVPPSQIPVFTSIRPPVKPRKNKSPQKSRPVLLSQKRKQKAARLATLESKPTSEPTPV